MEGLSEPVVRRLSRTRSQDPSDAIGFYAPTSESNPHRQRQRSRSPASFLSKGILHWNRSGGASDGFKAADA
jgi:hypothetical protein